MTEEEHEYGLHLYDLLLKLHPKEITQEEFNTIKILYEKYNKIVNPKGSKMKIRIVNMIKCSDWDETVMETYGRPYCFQQQDECKERGTYTITVPNSSAGFQNDTVPEIVNGEEMGVSLKAWLARDPKQPLEATNDHIGYDWETEMWWERNFYPSIEEVADDLYRKGILPEGEYMINIDW